MKFILLNGIVFPHTLIMKYLKAKGLEYWYYTTTDMQEFFRMPKEEMKRADISRCLMLTKDMGERFEGGEDYTSHMPALYMMSDMRYRTDKVLIELIEKHERYERHLSITDIPCNEKFYIETDESCKESVVLESEISWMTLAPE